MPALSILTLSTFPHIGWVCSLTGTRVEVAVLCTVVSGSCRLPACCLEFSNKGASTLLNTYTRGPFPQRNCSLIIYKTTLFSTFHINIQREGALYKGKKLHWLLSVPSLCVSFLRYQQCFSLLRPEVFSHLCCFWFCTRTCGHLLGLYHELRSSLNWLKRIGREQQAADVFIGGPLTWTNLRVRKARQLCSFIIVLLLSH